MLTHTRFLPALGFLLLSFATIAWGQTPFLLQARLDSNVVSLQNNSTLNMAADSIGATVTVHLTVTYQGRSTATLANPLLYGPTDFLITNSYAPVSLQFNDSVSLDINYTPSTSTLTAGQLLLGYTENTVGSQAGTSGNIAINLAGSAPELVLAYALQTDQNSVPLADGGSIVFLDTPISTTASASVSIVNRGSAPGQLKSVAIAGSATFRTAGTPLLPSSLAAGGTLSFLVRYTPTDIATHTGQLSVGIGDKILNFKLEGNSVGAYFSYTISPPGAAVLPDQTITFPETAVSDQKTVSVVVKNTGNASGTVSGIALSGAGLTITDAPFLPITLPPGNTFTLAIQFAPTVAGPGVGRLRIGNDSFILSTSALGSRLVFSYDKGSGSTVLGANAVVSFPETIPGSSSPVTFTVRNAGTTPVQVGSIGFTDSKAPYGLENLPALPVTVPPDGVFSFTAVFVPVGPGLITATLLIDTQLVGFAGLGGPMPPLPPYQFSGALGVQDPLKQPSVGLALSSTYPLPLKGTLTIAFASDAFVTDPAIQFSTGGTTVAFTIPANATQAVFSNGAQAIRLQTGTVAGSIAITPSFATESAIDVTPGSPAPLLLSVAPAAPVLSAVQVTSLTASGFTLQITGYSTPRTLKSLEFSFSAAAGISIPQGTITVPVESGATAWYLSQASQAFGGQFTVSIPYTMTISSGSSGATLANLISSVAVTATNDVGQSNTVQSTLQ